MSLIFNTIKDVWTYLDQIPMFSKVGASASNFGLASIKDFCNRIGNPQDQFTSIHVAGTNGKGTVTLLLESVYRNAGYKTGAFTSPHLLQYNERVKINGKDISNEKILEFFQTFASTLEERNLTYFEISTALAFWAFVDAKVDIAIIEAGLGGRLDSTNIITPECAVITSIGLDHQDILGNSKVEIAREKAGIIKENIPLVLGKVEGEELNEIIRKANFEKSLIYFSTDLKPIFQNGIVTLNSISKTLKTNFIEPVNANNIAIVQMVTEILAKVFPVNQDQFITSIESFKGVPARFEKLSKKEDWYFSGAHNPEAIYSLISALERFKGRKITFVLSVMKDKITSELLKPFQAFDNIFFYEQVQDRAAKLEDISAYLSVESIDELNAERILDELKQEVVIFAGSFYFYGIVKRWLTHLN